MNPSIAISLSLLLAASCKTESPDTSKVKDAIDIEATAIPPLVCDKGDLTYFVMKAPAEGPKLADFKIPPPAKGQGDVLLSPIKDMVARLDICVAGEVPTLKRVVFGTI